MNTALADLGTVGLGTLEALPVAYRPYFIRLNAQSVLAFHGAVADERTLFHSAQARWWSPTTRITGNDPRRG